jgi:hypothetical protein
VYARLKPVVPVAQAIAELETLHPELIEAELGNANPPLSGQKRLDYLASREATRLDLTPVSRLGRTRLAWELNLKRSHC